ncbi:MAG: plasmid stabilization protein [Pseudomonadota bacterium]
MIRAPSPTHTPDSLAPLVTSLRTLGLLQNLAGLRDAEAPETVWIVAGGRRLAALQAIAAADGRDPAEILVPVRLTEDEAEARAWAGAENLVRTRLHPAEEIRAYGRMARGGSTLPEIALAFGLSERHVRGRLKLAGLPEPVLEALATDTITLETAQAYALGADPDRVLAVFGEMQSAHANDRYRIRARLSEHKVRLTDSLSVFVGRAAYEAAGGAVTEDLFGEDVWLDDRALLEELAGTKLVALAEELRAEGWAWVSTSLERLDYNALSAHGRVYPAPVEAGDEEAARYDALAELIEAGAASGADEAEFEALAARLDAELYSPEQMAQAGAILALGHGGQVRIERGLIEPEAIGAAIEAGLVEAARYPKIAEQIAKAAAAAGEDAEEAAEAAPEAPEPAGQAYSMALAEDLGVVRTAALQSALLAQPDLVLDLLGFVLTTPLYHGTGIGLSTDPAANTTDRDPGIVLPEALARDWARPLGGEAVAEAFARFRTLKKRDRDRARTEAVARLVSIGLNDAKANPFCEALAEAAGLDAHLRPTWVPSEAFLTRLKKGQLLAIHAWVMRDAEASRRLEKQPKKDIATWLGLILAVDDKGPRLSPAQEARARAWVPEGLMTERGKAALIEAVERGDDGEEADDGAAEAESGPQVTGEPDTV